MFKSLIGLLVTFLLKLALDSTINYHSSNSSSRISSSFLTIGHLGKKYSQFILDAVNFYSISFLNSSSSTSIALFTHLGLSSN
jgi:hypothetical protein